MSNNKITFGKPKTPTQQTAYIPEPAPENIDNRQVYDFGNKYAVLDFKFKELQDGAVYTAGFDVTPGLGSFIFTTTFYNRAGEVLNSSSVEVPEGTPIESFELDYEGKQLIIHTVDGDDITADLSELIDKVETLESEMGVVNETIFMDDVIPDSEDNLDLVSLGVVDGENLNLGTRGDESNENLLLNSQKTVAFYNKIEMNAELATLNYETSVGTDLLEPVRARTWFHPVDGENIEYMQTFEPMMFEQQVSFDDSPEVSPFSASISAEEELQVESIENELNPSSASLESDNDEQQVGFTDTEAGYIVEGDSNNELSVGTSDSELTGQTGETNGELIPGFSENEVR